MLEQESFLKKLAWLADYAGECGNVLTKDEVEKAFSGMELAEQQFDLIYRYLFEKKITVRGILIDHLEDAPDFKPDWMRGNEKDSAENKEDFLWCEEDKKGAANWEDSEDSRYLQIYLEELEQLPKVTESERLELAMRLLAGEEIVFHPLLEATLYEVVEIARTYLGRGVLLADLIQEGNIALMQVLKEITGKKMQKEPLRYIKEYVQYEMEQYIDEEAALGDEEERVVAKLGLLHEAAKYMAKENGELPSEEELAAFTKIPVQEIAELIRLSQDVNFVGESNAEK